MKILNDIAELDKQIQNVLLQVEPLRKQRTELVQKLMNLCPHTETYDDGYDNPDGYGGSNWIKNLKCKICGIEMKNKK